MSQENVETVRRALDAYRTDGIEALLYFDSLAPATFTAYAYCEKKQGT